MNNAGYIVLVAVAAVLALIVLVQTYHYTRTVKRHYDDAVRGRREPER